MAARVGNLPSQLAATNNIKIRFQYWQRKNREIKRCAATLFQELELYKPELVNKPAILILNKIDTEGAEKICDVTVEKVKAMQGNQSFCYATVGYTYISDCSHRFCHHFPVFFCFCRPTFISGLVCLEFSLHLVEL